MFDIEKIRKDFPMISNNPELIYFDSSATSFKPQCVIDEIVNYYTYFNSNIHRGDYDISVNVSNQYDKTRKSVASFINAKDYRSIIFSNGATSSLNQIAYEYGLNYINENDVILTTEVEHASNILPWFVVSKKRKAKIEYIPLNDDASFNIDYFKQCFEKYKNIKVVSITHVSNVMGYVYPIKQICEIAHKYGAIVSVDGAQSVPHIKIDVTDLDCDFMSFSSHKMCGPSGIGILYGKFELLDKIDPLFYGGGSNARFDKEFNIILKNTPEKYESGTPNIEGVLGLNKAIEYLQDLSMQDIENYTEELTKYFIDKLLKLDKVEIYNKKSTCGIVTFNVKGIFAQDVASYLNSKNIAVRTGNHCAKILHNIIGVNETIRASLYFYNTKEEIDKFVDIIKDTTIEKCVDSVL